MIEKPDIADEKIISALRQSYLIQAKMVEFLPLGWDAASFSYRVVAEEGTFFLKIRRGLPNPAGISVPRYLREQGFEQVMGALSTRRGEAWAKVDDLYFILYPFIVSRQVWDVGMSDAHWVEFGSVMKRLHTLRLSAEMLGQMRIENFVPPRLKWDRDLHSKIKECRYDDPYQKELAESWLAHYSTISTILQRTEALSGAMHNTDLEIVLCHADVHSANLLITEDDRMFIVDWDDTLRSGGCSGQRAA